MAQLYLVRHAKAGERRLWTGDDIDRPLSRKGWQQSERIAKRLSKLDPTMLLFCPGKEARLSKYCEVGKPFTVNVLAANQQNTSNHFAGADMAPEHGFVDWPEADGPPRIDGCVAALACRIRKMLDGGDHWIVLGEVTALHCGEETDDPLVFYAGTYRRLAETQD